jgi:hypothetical protein
MQRNVHQQRTDDPTLRASPLGRGQVALVENPGAQPLPDHRAGGERAQRPEEMIMV